MEAVETVSPARTVIAAGTELQGSLVGTVGVTVEGQFAGEVKAPSLTVTAGAAVRGRVEVGELESRGKLGGEVRARRARLAGQLEDGTALHAESLEVSLPTEDSTEPGLVLGRCTLEVGNEPPR